MRKPRYTPPHKMIAGALDEHDQPSAGMHRTGDEGAGAGDEAHDDDRGDDQVQAGIDAQMDTPRVARIDRPSKTALKKQAHDLQELGDQLAALPTEKLERIEISEALRQALAELQRTRSHEGRRRQRQYVGKLMRQQDVAPLRQAVAEVRIVPAREALALHQAEAWRSELAADDQALTRFVAEHPDCDAQRLRQLVRNARKDAALPPEQRHGRAWRELYQFIKPLMLQASEKPR